MIVDRLMRMLPLYTGLQNPDFGKVAEVIGFWGRTVTKADELEDAVITWLKEPGPALLNVKVDTMTLVMRPKIEWGGCVRNGPVFGESHAAGAVRRCVRHDPRKSIGLAGLSGAAASAP
jgi:hypothetical protein